jgi:type II secretory pathway pseudopilin PulG
MKFAPTTWSTCVAKRSRSAFTLAEALAALAFMAIVIPVAVEGLRVANQAGQVADRKAAAGRVADRVLNELLVTKQWQQASSSGEVQEGRLSYRWRLLTEAWVQDTLKQLTVLVTYSVQGQDYDVRLSTLVDSAQQ